MKLLVSLAFLFSFSLFAQEEKRELIGVMYFNENMGNVHQNASRFSQTLTTISCNHPVKIQKITTIYSKENGKENKREEATFGNGNWLAVSVGPYEGYVMKDLLSNKKVECFQDAHPKYFEQMGFSLSELYYFGRLHDQYYRGKSKAGIE